MAPKIRKTLLHNVENTVLTHFISTAGNLYTLFLPKQATNK